VPAPRGRGWLRVRPTVPLGVTAASELSAAATAPWRRTATGGQRGNHGTRRRGNDLIHHAAAGDRLQGKSGAAVQQGVGGPPGMSSIRPSAARHRNDRASDTINASAPGQVPIHEAWEVNPCAISPARKQCGTMRSIAAWPRLSRTLTRVVAGSRGNRLSRLSVMPLR